MRDPISPPEMIGEAPAFLDVLALASSVAVLERPVLVAGERGTGKELLAARLHFLSTRWDGLFVKVNCAALSEELLESELFGHEAGAFTGATKRHQGRFERAEGGTLFLDEISSASLRIQEKLLRVIEYGEYERLGGDTTLIADVRVVAAANMDLRSLAREGKFRADLLDRLSFEVITAPPLRARREDIPLLAAHFAGRFATELSTTGLEISFEGFTPEATQTLLAHHWPGNVRELKNVSERSLYRWVASDRTGPLDEIIIDPFASAHAPQSTLPSSQPPEASPEAPHIPRPTLNAPQTPEGAFDLRSYLHDTEEQLARQALDKNGWNQKRTATYLSLTYDQMRGLIRKHDLKEG